MAPILHSHPQPKELAQIVRDAGMLALENFRPGKILESWDKTPGHPVTKTDLAVDGYLREALGRLNKDAGWLSEESDNAASRHDDQPMWIVDPIDGTRDFIRGRNGWAVSVAYCVGGVPQLAALYAPAKDQMWMAVRGEGADCNGQALSGSQRQSLNGARVPTDSLSEADNILSMVEKPNSIALRMAMIASDQADLVATLRWGYAWDLAAAALIVLESGAMATEATGKPLIFTSPRPVHFGVLCSAKGIHDAALTHLRPRAEKISAQSQQG